MKKTQILGIVRHVLTFGGGLLAGKGVIDESVAVEITGALITLIGIVWSYLDKK